MKRLLLALAAMMTLAMPALGDEFLCPQHFLAGKPPAATVAGKTYTLCYTGYADLYSAVTRTPVFAAEHLTAERVAATKGASRVDTFHPDPHVPKGDRSEEADYAASGFDRGHQAPFDDMADPVSQHESFSLANMIPQAPENNRGLWAEIERAVRKLAATDGDVYVVTGPIFDEGEPQRLHDRVAIPAHIFKAVWDVRRRAGAAYVVPNAPGHEVRQVSLADLQHMTGIDPFPGAASEASVLDLPAIR